MNLIKGMVDSSDEWVWVLVAFGERQSYGNPF